MPTYRITSVKYHWNDPAVLYSTDLWVEGSSVKGHKEQKKAVFSATDDGVADKVFVFYLNLLNKILNGWWECQLEEIEVGEEKTRVIREIKRESRGVRPTDMVE